MTPNVFIVDDEVRIQELYKRILESYGFNIVGVANNGDEAVFMYQKLVEKPDVILMDYSMPIKNGIEATEEILKLNNHPKVIFISAYPNKKELALSIGALHFLDKPFDLKELINTINNVLGHPLLEAK